MIEKMNGLPVYRQIEAAILSNIRNGVWSEDDKLPSEDDLAKYFGVSRGTVRRAIGELVNEGVLKRLHGHGTFVAKPGHEYKIDTDNFLSFLEEMERTGVKVDTQVIAKGVAIPSPTLIKYLGNVKEVCYIKRIRKSDGKLIMFSIDHLPCQIFRDAVEKYDDSKSVYAFLERNYNVRISKVKRLFYAISAQGEIAKELNLKNGAPLFYIVQQAFDEQGRCIDCAYLYIISEEMHFSITTMRNSLDEFY